MTISANSITGYEVLCPVHASPTYPLQIVRWNGANGQYVVIGGASGTTQCVNGDQLEATVAGNNPVIIKASRNGVLVATACGNGGGVGATCGGIHL